ncbi:MULTISPECIES: DMT family transporter [Roseobacteraceae]|uniref:Riboflavin transporter n=1 Tax=Pseudosulfitobacter pseudonitzschiae TaxID=1402135 RepID=A0A221K2R1_9RHOB|nr:MULTISPECIES: DMT family transporter [Roseobacteraceae]ASM73302.1 riboflavin transporter [Pseudosulfitobacter pseudonitzschiae]
MTTQPQNRANIGILFILIGIFCISINDMLIKQLSGGYPLHEIVFVRSAIGVLITLFIVQLEGGWGILRTSTPWLHAVRGLLIVISNMSYFVALAALPLADATALFFAAPLFITLLSIPVLGEKVGPLRIGAVIAGFVGVVIMQRPWADAGELDVSRLVLLLPVLSALTYALNQLMTRKLGVTSKASALSVYIQVMFILVSLAFFAIAGDGRFAEGSTNASVLFLLRAWIWPASGDIWAFVGLGLNSAAVGYCLSQAYRMADAATVAPFEYVGLPLAVLWGWAVFSELPVLEVWIGITLILSSGLFVFLREQKKARMVARAKVKLR